MTNHGGTRLRTGRHLLVGAITITTALGASSTPVGAGAAGVLSQTFTATDAPGAFTVPADVCEVTIDAYGAEGGTGNSTDGVPSPGGLGGRATAALEVTPGEVLFVRVGAAGGDGSGSAAGAGGVSGGDPSGGAGGFGVEANDGGGGGGGSSDVRQGGTTLADRVVVAGGGGGGGADPGDATMGLGGAGGGETGGDGVNGDLTDDDFTEGGGGGTQTQGGAGGVETVGADPGEDGALGLGGDAGDGEDDGGGGGGGGLYGGGGGAADGGSADDGGGGGGGSGFGPAGVVYESGVEEGDGTVTISWDPAAATCDPPPVTPTPPPAAEPVALEPTFTG